MMNVLESKGYQFAAWACIAAVAAGTVLEAVRQDWSGVIFMSVFLLSAVVFVLQRSRLPLLFSFLFALAALINGAGWVFNFWERIPGYDPVAHAFTTFAGALAIGFLTFHSTRMHFQEHGWSFAISIAAFGLALGGLWEIFEWSIGVEQTYQSVVVDLIADSIGSLIAGGLAVWAVRSQSRDQLNVST